MPKQPGSRTISISVNCCAKKVCDFVSDLRNLPKWATAFAKSIEFTNGKWIIQTSEGPLTVRMCEKNNLGIVDHYVSPAPGVEIYVPMRIIANGDQSEIVFTLLKTPQMTEDRLVKDAELVAQDLNTLKRVIEQSR